MNPNEERERARRERNRKKWKQNTDRWAKRKAKQKKTPMEQMYDGFYEVYVKTGKEWTP